MWSKWLASLKMIHFLTIFAINLVAVWQSTTYLWMFEHKQSIITRCPISNVSGFDEKEVSINQKAAEFAHILSCVINKPFLSCCKNHNICFCFHSLYFVALQLWILKHEKGSLCVSHVSPANPHIDWTNPCKKLQCIKGLRCLEVLPKMLSSRKSLARESKP